MYTSSRRIRAAVVSRLRNLYLHEDGCAPLYTSHLEEQVAAVEQDLRFDPDAVDAWYRGLTDAQRQRLVQQAMRG